MPRRFRTTGCVIIVALVASCSASAPPSPEPATSRPAPPDAAPPPPAVTLPRGILARSTTRDGVVQVEHRDGRRMLTVDGVPLGSVTSDGAGPGSDPGAEFLRIVRPGSRRALVIGLGIGTIATALAAADLEVEVAERLPAVIEFARAHFGYRGHAVARDGLRTLKTATTKFDVIIVDRGGPELRSPGALRLMRTRLRHDGVVVLRVARPDNSQPLRALRKRLRSAMRSPFVHLLGGGDGWLYAIASPRPLNAVNEPGLPLWPVWTEDQLATWQAPVERPTAAGDHQAGRRQVSIVGYLIHLGRNRRLAVDIPHAGAGGIRYLLQGSEANLLRARLLPGLTFPTRDHRRTPAALASTLADVLGGGGVRRSDVRHSAVIVAIEGTASLRSLVHPDASSRAPRALRGDADTDRRLPHGGVLYDLDVSTIHWTVNRAQWRALSRTLTPEFKQVARLIDRDQLRPAARHLRLAAVRIQTTFRPLEHRVPAYRDANALVGRLYAETRSAATAPMALARACDVARAGPGDDASASRGQLAVVDDALLRCAIRHYRQAAADPGEVEKRAAGRLLFLLERAGDDAGARAVIQRFPDVDALETPPPG